jgi:hypothetical protein
MSGFFFSQFSKQNLCLRFELVLETVASVILTSFLHTLVTFNHITHKYSKTQKMKQIP